uniref:ATP synthase F0 subunit 8 n=1 Tax=Igerna tenuicaula TaxID=2172468 RepID=UPI003001CE9C|nr:ATP synthase F0 subunit 8 [Igerna tenuicaula]
MPQMAPIWWLSLSMMFNLTMLMTMSMIYFNKNTYLKTIFQKKKINLDWKW